MTSLCILGSTGSIGVQALEIAQTHKINIQALTAHRNATLLAKQARQFCPSAVAIADQSRYSELKVLLADTDIAVSAGPKAVAALAAENSAETVLNAIVGIAGLAPTMAAITAGKALALANKESLVAGGALVTAQAKRMGVPILPVDSEHSAIFQCLQGNKRAQLRKVILTASGGPFFGYTSQQLRTVTRAQALAHPNWEMGAKITIDSATMMNKGLELIEAMWLFDLTPQEVEIIIHRQSIIHSMVEYQDHSVIAQLGMPDMRVPIQYALSYPERLHCPVEPLSLTEIGKLTFDAPDYDTFPCLQAAVKAAQRGGAMPCIVNGANEQAVALFLEDRIAFHQIGELVLDAVNSIADRPLLHLHDVFAADQTAREYILKKAEGME